MPGVAERAGGGKSMIVAGCDVGALTAKAVIMEGGSILGSELIQSRASADRSAREVMDRLLTRLRIGHQDVEYCVSTGYGRCVIPFADENVSEISCHARGAHWLVPSIRTVIDVGGQDCKAIRLDGGGVLRDFRMNTKCAAGTGRSLEIMAESLGVDVSRLGPLSLEASEPVVLQNPCCIMTEIEIRYLIMEGVRSADIAAGVCDITARRILHLARNLGIRRDVGITGGVAKNMGVVNCLERALGTRFVEFAEDPQLIGAIGAAAIAAGRVGRAA